MIFLWSALWPALLLAGVASAAGPAELEYAALRHGQVQYWRASGGEGAAAAATLPAGLSTPLGSLWKLFVYAYLADRGLEAPDYVCGGHDREEVYCCVPGGSIGREAALARSCGLFFAPGRLGIAGADWSAYWRARHAPDWLTDLERMRPDSVVAVDAVLQGLATVPETARRQAGGSLLASLLGARDPVLVQHFGASLRAKTYSWHDPQHPGERLGGAGGWLVDGTPVWFQGQGTSRTVLPRAAAHLPADLASLEAVPDAGCVRVALFDRYPLAAVEVEGGGAARFGPLDGRFVARFMNGNRLAFTSRGEVSLLNGAPPRLEARLGINDYVARVLEREAAARPLAAARALAVAARSYLMQQARREGACLVLPDSSASQRVSASPAGVAAREVAAWTDSLVLTGVPVQYHLDEAGPNRLAWRQAVAWAQAGAGFEEILARAYPGAALGSTESPLATDCHRLPEAERWVASQARRWRPRLIAEAGYETPPPPTVCRLDLGNPYADPARGRIYARGLTGREGRLTLAHEYLHLAFAQHPAGRDEAWIETLARRLLLEGAP